MNKIKIKLGDCKKINAQIKLANSIKANALAYIVQDLIEGFARGERFSFSQFERKVKRIINDNDYESWLR